MLIFSLEISLLFYLSWCFYAREAPSSWFVARNQVVLGLAAPHPYGAGAQQALPWTLPQGHPLVSLTCSREEKGPVLLTGSNMCRCCMGSTETAVQLSCVTAGVWLW